MGEGVTGCLCLFCLLTLLHKHSLLFLPVGKNCPCNLDPSLHFLTYMKSVERFGRLHCRFWGKIEAFCMLQFSLCLKRRPQRCVQVCLTWLSAGG